MQKKKLVALAENLPHHGCRWHVLMCAGPDCCDSRHAKAAWKALKKALKHHGLDDGLVLRSKVDCLDVCQGGPIVVVYPGGIWYGAMTADRMDRFVSEHLVQGRPVREWVFVENPLGRAAGPRRQPTDCSESQFRD